MSSELFKEVETSLAEFIKGCREKHDNAMSEVQRAREMAKDALEDGQRVYITDQP